MEAITYKTKAGAEVSISMQVLESGKPVATVMLNGEPLEYTGLTGHPQAGIVIRAGGKMIGIDPAALKSVEEFDKRYSEAAKADAKRAYAELYGHDYSDSYEARRVSRDRSVERVGGGNS